MDVGEARQGDGHHLRRGVQLHGAGAERDHGAIERHVPVLQPLEVAQHLVLGAVRAEHGVRQDGAGAQQSRRDRRRRARQLRPQHDGKDGEFG